MRGYASHSVFSEPSQRDHALATTIVGWLPERDDEDRLIRCHEVVRAVRPYLQAPKNWRLVEGFYRTVDHTWLENAEGPVLDLYSVARYPMVQLMDSDIHFHRDLFRPSRRRWELRPDVLKGLRKHIKRCLAAVTAMTPS